MRTKQPSRPHKRRYYTLEEANATLPLLRVILRDIPALAVDLRGQYERLVRMQEAEGLDQDHKDEVYQLVEEFERGQEKMREYEQELERLDVELKDYNTGLVDVWALRDGREVYLCWRLDEPEITHWHEINAGFQGRRKLETNVING